MKTIKKIAVLFAIVICILLIKKTECFAMTQAEAGQYIGSYAANFAKQHGTEVIYDRYSNYNRKMAYNLQKVNGYYRMDCVGFVNLVIHQSIGLDDPHASSGSGGFVNPFGGDWGYDNQWGNYFDDMGKFTAYDTSNLMVGDIIANGSHVMVWIGNGQIAHCAGWNGGPRSEH